MKKIIYAAGKRGGKTGWIIENIEAEYNAGKECFYMGGRKTFEDITKRLEENNNSSIKVDDDKDKNIKSSSDDKVQKMKEIANKSKIDLLKSRVLGSHRTNAGHNKINEISDKFYKIYERRKT